MTNGFRGLFLMLLCKCVSLVFLICMLCAHRVVFSVVNVIVFRCFHNLCYYPYIPCMLFWLCSFSHVHMYFYIVYLQWVEEIKLYKYNDIIRTIAWCVFLVVTCVPDEVSNSAKSPDQATYDYLTNVTYTCNIGYVLTSGDATRTCQADGNWNGTVPMCSSKKML